MGKLKKYVVKKRFFKYGTHEEGEQVSFDSDTAKGLIPKFLEEVEVKDGAWQESEPKIEQEPVPSQEKAKQGAKGKGKGEGNKTKKDE